MNSFETIGREYRFFQANSSESTRTIEKIESLLRRRPVPARVLDFGGGDGSFFRALLRQKSLLSQAVKNGSCRVSLVEPSRAHRERARASFPGLMTRARLSKRTVGFDLILANHVIYYLDDPEETIRRLQRLLNPGGMLLVTMARSRENALTGYWVGIFSDLGWEMPFVRAEDLRKAWNGFRRYPIRSRVRFSDTPANRFMLSRFVLGRWFDRVERALGRKELLERWGSHRKSGELQLTLVDDLYCFHRSGARLKQRSH
ncbi:class I SAM-dependent methyltransferase [bacterium]|nr:class I SAM-dependent methyltransferase [bacterium]